MGTGEFGIAFPISRFVPLQRNSYNKGSKAIIIIKKPLFVPTLYGGQWFTSKGKYSLAQARG